MADLRKRQMERLGEIVVRTGIDKLLDKDELAGLMIEGMQRLEADASLREAWWRKGKSFLRELRRPAAEMLADFTDAARGDGKMYH